MARGTKRRKKSKGTSRRSKSSTSSTSKTTTRKRVKAGLFDSVLGNKSITSENGKYVHPGTREPLRCFQCKGETWKVNSFAFGGRVADAFDVDWLTDKTYYAYTCENCTEVRFKKNALVRGDRADA